jgi:hypothetical protein
MAEIFRYLLGRRLNQLRVRLGVVTMLLPEIKRQSSNS